MSRRVQSALIAVILSGVPGAVWAASGNIHIKIRNEISAAESQKSARDQEVAVKKAAVNAEIDSLKQSGGCDCHTQCADSGLMENDHDYQWHQDDVIDGFDDCLVAAEWSVLKAQGRTTGELPAQCDEALKHSGAATSCDHLINRFNEYLNAVSARDEASGEVDVLNARAKHASDAKKGWCEDCYLAAQPFASVMEMATHLDDVLPDLDASKAVNASVDVYVERQELWRKVCADMWAGKTPPSTDPEFLARCGYSQNGGSNQFNTMGGGALFLPPQEFVYSPPRQGAQSKWIQAIKTFSGPGGGDIVDTARALGSTN